MVGALVAAVAGCSGDTGGVDVFSPAEWNKIKGMSPLGPLAADTTNNIADNMAAATFGQRLFFEKGFSGAIVQGLDAGPMGAPGDPNAAGNMGDTGKVGCTTCHDPSTWFDDKHGTDVSLGIKYTSRNDPSLVNVGFYEYYGWGGKQDSLWMQATSSMENANGSDRLAIAHLIYSKYKTDYNNLFMPALDPALDPVTGDMTRFPAHGKPSTTGTPGAWEMMAAGDQLIVNTILANAAKAVAAYERQLVSLNAPFDQYVAHAPAGKLDDISDAAKRGLRLFIGKAACSACHSGAFFTDEGFHNTGVAETGPHLPTEDTGHFGDLTSLIASPFNGGGAFSDDPTTGKSNLAELGMPSDADKGKFRTKNLRQIAQTAPYMHTGTLATLADVVNYYNQGGDASGFDGTKDAKMVPLNLTPDEVTDLVSFLQTLTGDPVPAALTQDTHAM
jgi:cytochrome c peroxidase